MSAPPLRPILRTERKEPKGYRVKFDVPESKREFELSTRTRTPREPRSSNTETIDIICRRLIQEGKLEEARQLSDRIENSKLKFPVLEAITDAYYSQESYEKAIETAKENHQLQKLATTFLENGLIPLARKCVRRINNKKKRRDLITKIQCVEKLIGNDLKGAVSAAERIKNITIRRGVNQFIANKAVSEREFDIAIDAVNKTLERIHQLYDLSQQLLREGFRDKARRAIQLTENTEWEQQLEQYLNANLDDRD